MAETMTYDAALETVAGGACLAQILDLPGCFAAAADETSALMALAAAIPYYYAWLRSHDEYTPIVAGPFAVVAGERHSTAAGAARACEARAFFAPDAQPVTGEDLDWLLALLRWSLADLAAAPGIDDALAHHIAQAQARDLAPLGDAPAPDALVGPPPRVLDALATWTEARVRVATPEALARIVLLADGARWSVRWALRRAIVHARWHTLTTGGVV